MSAVSSESPLAAADLSEPSANPSSRHGSQRSRAPAGQRRLRRQRVARRRAVPALPRDPGSVDRAWWCFFADYRPVRGERDGTAARPAGWRPAETRTRHALGKRERPGAPAGPPPRRRPPPPRPAPQRRAPPPRRPRGQPAKPPAAEPAAVAPPPSDADLSRLRGAAARTAQNMAASLGVPTATSVRAVPAKLLIDNRIVINNHLQRGRGGKISFTHLIGYARGPGGQGAPGDERRVRRGRRQAGPRRPAPREPRPGDRPARPRTAAASSSCPTSRAPRRWTSASSGRPTRTWSARHAAAS